MQKGVVDPWVPKARWDTISRKQVKETPATEWFLWLVGIVYDIEVDGRALDFKPKGTKPNPYRDSIVDRACMEALKSKHPTKSEVVDKHGALVARIFAKGTQGRADVSRSLRPEVKNAVEEHGPQLLSAPEMERLRAVLTHGRRGVSQAAPAAGARQRLVSPKGTSSSPTMKQR